MFRPTLVAVVALLSATPAVAQTEPAARPAAPVETLEALTGKRATEPGPERDEIETDRDSFTPATSTAGRGRLITEAAYSFIDNRGVKETHSVPELILRYGLTDRVELRLGWNYEVGGESSEVSSAGVGEPEAVGSAGRLVREYTLTYGVKVRVTDQAGWVPRSSVILQGLTPTGGSAGTSTATDLVAAYAVGWHFRTAGGSTLPSATPPRARRPAQPVGAVGRAAGAGRRAVGRPRRVLRPLLNGEG